VVEDGLDGGYEFLPLVVEAHEVTVHGVSFLGVWV
jgi:hypothetical protein